MFKKATRKKLKARIAIEGPTGCGKTFTALRWGFALAGPGGRVAVIDTEHRSASKYIGEAPDDIPWQFDVCELQHYSPSNYTQAIREAAAVGYTVLVIDSFSHAWEGVGGTLDQVDRKAASGVKGGSFGAWREASPMHREMVEAILAAPMHVIVTMRSKMHYAIEEVEKDGRLKTQVTKVGLRPIQREGVEYEFDVIADLDIEHLVLISKSRCPQLDGARAAKPGAPFILPLMRWLDEGELESTTTPATAEPPSRPGVRLSGQQDLHEQEVHDPCTPGQQEKIKGFAKTAGVTPDQLKAVLAGKGIKKLAELDNRQAETLIAKLAAKATAKEMDEIPF